MFFRAKFHSTVLFVIDPFSFHVQLQKQNIKGFVYIRHCSKGFLEYSLFLNSQQMHETEQIFSLHIVAPKAQESSFM